MKRMLNIFMVLLLAASTVLPAFAADTPSVRQNGAPTVIEVSDKAAEVFVVPLMEKDKASWQVRQELDTSVEALHEGDLTQVQAVQDAVKALNEQRVLGEEQAPAEIKAEDLVVSEVFYVSATEKNLTGTFEVEGIKAGQFLMVMVFVNGEWVVLDADSVRILEDGKVCVAFREYGPVAFAVNKNEVAAAVAAK